MPQAKAGSSKAAVTERREAFKQAYLANGHNATQAAIKAGYSQKTAYSAGQRLLKHVEISGDLAKAAKRAGEAASLEAERALQEVCRIAFSDPRKFFRKDGSIKPPSEWDADMAAAVASYEVIDGRAKIKFCDKLGALQQAMRHLGLYERDTHQQRENLVLQVNLVGAPDHALNGQAVEVQTNLVKPNSNGRAP